MDPDTSQVRGKVLDGSQALETSILTTNKPSVWSSTLFPSSGCQKLSLGLVPSEGPEKGPKTKAKGHHQVPPRPGGPAQAGSTPMLTALAEGQTRQSPDTIVLMIQ